MNIFWKEYIDGCKRNGSQCSDEQLKHAFSLFDLDHNGVLDYKVIAKWIFLIRMNFKFYLKKYKEFYCAMNYLTAIHKK